MALFKRNFDKPGPGVPKNAPKKRGIARFFEILGRDFGNLVKLNLLYALCSLPSQALLFFAFLCFIGVIPGLSGGIPFLLFSVLALVASIPIGPALTVLCKIISKMLRDEPGFLWHDFKKEFRSNFRQMLIPGILYSLVVGAQLIAFLFYTSYEGTVGFILVAVYFFSVLLFAMAFPYFFTQAAYIDLPNGVMLRNSLLLALGNAPRSIAGALLNTGLIILQLLFLPPTLVILLFLGYTIPLLLNLMFIWSPIDKAFNIEKTLKEREADSAED